MSDNKDSDEREQISKNDEVKVYDIVEDLKVVKFISHKYIQTMLRQNMIKEIWWICVIKRTLLKEMRSVKMMKKC